MAFVHCHGTVHGPCNWEQDDFWSWSYNPIETFLDYVKTYIRPRWVGTDRYCVSTGKLAKFLGTVRVIERPWPHVDKACEAGGVVPKTMREHQEFSWSILGKRFIYMIRKFRTMRWWTWNSYVKARNDGKAACPKCGNAKLCVD
jgi:hypothetical protein